MVLLLFLLLVVPYYVLHLYRQSLYHFLSPNREMHADDVELVPSLDELLQVVAGAAELVADVRQLPTKKVLCPTTGNLHSSGLSAKVPSPCLKGTPA